MHMQRLEPGPGQESVWDYPRPPRLEECTKHIQVVFNSVIIADTRHALRLLETSHPPVYYVPPTDLHREYLVPTTRTTLCEWKGSASYYTVSVHGKNAPHAAWSYHRPVETYRALTDSVAFYPSAMDACLVDGERVQAQAGDFYGGWITHEIVGPFKGEPGTTGW